MINKETIDKILESTRIEEVVGDFVSLKKRGVNLLGNCPFHNEKTPSFTVSAAKGIFKCFGCGKAGNSVHFIMEHEHFTYPEALKYLAKKYSIEVDEEEITPQQQIEQSKKESLYNVHAFAQKHFSENLNNTDEGKAIGYSYFKERGFSDIIIEKFQLGYCLDKWDEFSQLAITNAYNIDVLKSSGLSIENENHQVYDRFRGRVIFPIHNLTGRVIGFGGRILSAEKSKAKYVNSPETDIYHKSNVLYGLHLAKTGIISKNNCFLVEGYTDVISMHIAGVENVVASSGTSLTVEQIKLIKRYTSNITILFDGDAAGIKASFRGIDMILEEGMNVRIVLFPDGQDPDSFARNNSSSEVLAFIDENSADFIAFKTKLLLSETQNDPIKKATLVKEIIQSVSLIPDGISRSYYVKECSSLMDISEQILLNELNKLRKKKYAKQNDLDESEVEVETTEYTSEKQVEGQAESSEWQEKELIRFMLTYGNMPIKFESKNEDDETVEFETTVAEYMISDLTRDNILFRNPVYQGIVDEYISEVAKGIVPDNQYFMQHQNSEICKAAINLVSSRYSLSKNWERHHIYVQTEEDAIKESAISYVHALKFINVEMMFSENMRKIKETTDDEDIMLLLNDQKELIQLRFELSKILGLRVITK